MNGEQEEQDRAQAGGEHTHEHVAAVEELERQLFARNAELAAANRQLSREITARRQLEAEKARLALDLAEAVRLRDEFLTLASHEFKTPVTALHLQLQAIAAAIERVVPDRTTGERLSARMRIAQRQVDRLTRLVDGLLDIVRLSTGRLQLDLEEVDLRSVLEEVAARFAEETQLVESPIALRIGPRLVGHWDRQRLEMVFTNLLSNAVKFGAHRPIAVTARAVGGDVIVQVRDEGIGVAPEDHERIFERFGRAVSGRHYGGFGLGLWMAREAVRAQGGDITVQSRPGEGATFTVRLPRRGPSNKTESPPRSQH